MDKRSLIKLDTIEACVESWSKINQRGSSIIASIDKSDPSKTSNELKTVIVELRQVLDGMYAICDATAGEKRDALLSYVAMYDQEYMVKESICSILCEPGFFTQQHLTGCAVLWTTQVYLNDKEPPPK